MPLLLGLSVWQFNRAEEKRQLLELQAHRQSAGLISLSANQQDDIESLLYQKTRVTGRYDNHHQFLLDNQIMEGKAGYFVLTPLLLDGTDKAVLVNRGWLPLGKVRAERPDLSVEEAGRNITGRINRFPRPGLVLPGAEIPNEGWPSVIQVVDSERLAKRLGYRLFGFQVELDQDTTDGFIRKWHERTVMPPEKHVAYAVQWLLLALTLTIIFFKYGLNQKQ